VRLTAAAASLLQACCTLHLLRKGKMPISQVLLVPQAKVLLTKFLLLGWLPIICRWLLHCMCARSQDGSHGAAPVLGQPAA
jgi:hypothetical protein